MRVVIVAVCWHCVQEELLLTLEDYCSEQDVFANQGEHGHAYADLFAKVSNSLNPGSSSTVTQVPGQHRAHPAQNCAASRII